MDSFDSISVNEKVKDSLSKLLNRDSTALTLSAGTTNPDNLNKEMVGRLVNRTDLQSIYTLTSYDPVNWKLVVNYSQTKATESWVQSNYQPLNQKLTNLSAINFTTNSVPVFINSTQMSTVTLTSFSKDFITSTDAANARTKLGLGSMALKSSINGSTDISNNSITENKLSFTPLKSSDAFTTGGLKETYSNETIEGWVNYELGSIGNASSGAGYANNNCYNLFVLMWSLSGITVSPSKGSSAASDWSANKKIILPTKPAYSSNTYLRIKL